MSSEAPLTVATYLVAVSLLLFSAGCSKPPHHYHVTQARLSYGTAMDYKRRSSRELTLMREHRDELGDIIGALERNVDDSEANKAECAMKVKKLGVKIP